MRDSSRGSRGRRRSACATAAAGRRRKLCSHGYGARGSVSQKSLRCYVWMFRSPVHCMFTMTAVSESPFSRYSPRPG